MNVIFFDGHCNLCNRFVDFLIKRDRKRVLKFAPLQGRTAEAKLPLEYRQKLGTIVYDQNGEFHVRSTAALKILISLGGLWTLVGIFFVIPRFVRDLVYRWIAKNRYLWFGRRDTCRLPTPEERAQFLD